MKKQCLNPYLPFNEYVADGEPHIFGDRIYIYGSHDKENGEVYCMLDYVCYSAPLDDLSDWRYEGVIYKREQDPHYAENVYLWAPDICQGPDGRYYMYYILSNELQIAVAVCDQPAGKYTYLGRVSYADGTTLEKNIPFDPAVLNDDGKIYLYYGFAPTFPIPRMAGKEMPGASVVELEQDMLTVKVEPRIILPNRKYAAGTEFEGHAFFEACSIRKIDGLYYLVYCSELAHELCYAISTEPDGVYHYGGTIVSNADIGYMGNTVPKNCFANNHGGMECVNGQWYIFYHRHTHGHQCSRQGCAEKINLRTGEQIQQVEMTSCGLNGGPLAGRGIYSVAAACNLYSKNGGKALIYGAKLEDEPCISGEDERPLIKHFADGCTAVFKYFMVKDITKISVTVRGNGGTLHISDGAKDLTVISLQESSEFIEYTQDFCSEEEIIPIYFNYEGAGEIDFLSFQMA